VEAARIDAAIEVPANARAARPSVAATAAPGAAGGAPRAFARFVDMVQIRARDRVAIPRHDRIGDPVTLIRLDPRLHRAAAHENERGCPGREPRRAAREPGRAGTSGLCI